LEIFENISSVRFFTHSVDLRGREGKEGGGRGKREEGWERREKRREGEEREGEGCVMALGDGPPACYNFIFDIDPPVEKWFQHACI